MFPAPAAGGSYQLTLSGAGWIDVIQDGAYLDPSGFSGALDCPNVRKAVRFDVHASPFVLQISGVATDRIGVIVETAP